MSEAKISLPAFGPAEWTILWIVLLSGAVALAIRDLSWGIKGVVVVGCALLIGGAVAFSKRGSIVERTAVKGLEPVRQAK